MPEEKDDKGLNISFTGNFNFSVRRTRVPDPHQYKLDLFYNEVDHITPKNSMLSQHDWSVYIKEKHEAALKSLAAVEADVEQSVLIGHNRPAAVSEKSSTPPSGFLVDLMTPSSSSDDFVANLEEIYPRYVKRYGDRGAKAVWYMQCAMRIVGYWAGVALAVFAKIPKT